MYLELLSQLKHQLFNGQLQVKQTFTNNLGANAFKDNIIVSFFEDLEDNKLDMVLTYKNTSYFYDLELDSNKESLFESFDPVLKNFNINFNSLDFVHNFYDGFANTVSDSCISGNGNIYCPNFPAKFKLFQSG